MQSDTDDLMGAQEAANAQLDMLRKVLRDCDKLLAVLKTAGFVSQEDIDNARQLIEGANNAK